MNSEQYQRVKDAFVVLKDLSPAERLRWREGHPLEDPVVAREVEVLLAVHEGEQDAPIPEQIGPYRILSLLGEGGMGLVYEAEQPSPRRRVAVKVMRPGLAGRSALRRFEHEAEILGRLHHPGIARIFEAGVDRSLSSPRPWLAMERIHGLALGEWARSGPPDRRAKIELVIQIARAVDHAHTRGIIHRDLKPENVFVDDEGCAKVLDFGIARALDAERPSITQHTEAGRWLGTLPYTSPEQLDGDPDAIDPRTDVYALGVVAYELLAGVTPIDVAHAHPAEAARRILSAEPTRPSLVDRTLSGDLDVILLKALEKDPERRYASAAGFADDLQRHLDHLPIFATSATRRLRFRKFCRRNRGLVAGLGVAALTLVAAAAVSLDAARRAIDARDELKSANVELDERSGELALEVERLGVVSEFLQQMLTEADPMRGTLGQEEARELRLVDLLEPASTGLGEAYADRPLIEATLRRTLGLTWRNLRDHESALPELERAVALLEAELGAAHPEALRANLDLLGVRSFLSPEAVEESIAALRQRCVEAFGACSAERYSCDNLMTATLVRLRRWDEALILGEQTFLACLRDLGEVHEETLVASHDLACVYREASRFSDAERQLATTLRLKEQAFGPDHPRLHSTRNEQVILYFASGRAERAVALAAEQVEHARRIFGADHPLVDVARHQLAAIHLNLLQADQAEPVLRRALASVRHRSGEDSMAWQALRYQQARLLSLRTRFSEALAIDEEVLAWRRRRFGNDDPRTIESMNTVAAHLLQGRDLERAEELLVECVDRASEVFGANSDRLARYHIGLAHCLRLLDAFEDAEGQLLLALDIVEQRREHGALAYSVLEQLQMVAKLLGNSDEAEEWQERIAELRAQWGGAADRVVRD